MVDPIGPSDPTPPPAFSPTVIPNTFSPPATTDTFSVFSLPGGHSVGYRADIPILTFAKEVGIPVTESQKNLWAQQQENFKRLSAFYSSMATNSTILRGQLAALTSLQSEADSTYSTNDTNVSTYNNASTSYNTAQTTLNTYATNVNNDTIAYNNAYNAYNAPGGNTPANLAALNTAEANLNADINTYNAYLPTYNTALTNYNTEVTTFNNLTAATVGGQSGSTNDNLNIINSDATTLGVSSLIPSAQQTLATPILVSTPTTLTTAPPPPSTVGAVPGSTSLSNDIPASYQASSSTLQPAIDAASALLDTSDDNLRSLQNQNKYLSYVQYFLQGRTPAVAAAYIEPIPSIFVGAGPGGGGASIASGASLTTLILTLSNPNVSSIVTAGLGAANDQTQILKSLQTLTNNLKLATQTLGINAAQQTEQQLLSLQLGTIDPNSPAVTSLLGINLAQFVAQYAGSNELKDSIKQFVEQEFSGQTLDQKIQLQQTLLSSAQIYLTSTALTTISQAVGLPNLPTQLFSNLANSSGITNSNTTPTGTTQTSSLTTFNNALGNPYTIAQLKIYLANQDKTTPLGTIETGVNSAINSGAFSTPGIPQSQQFGTAIANQFANLNTPPNTSSNLGATAAAFINGEAQLGPALESSASGVDNLSGALLAGFANSSLPQNVVEKSVNSTVQKFSTKDDFSVRQVRDQLANNLVKNNSTLTPADALTLATKAVAGFTTPPVQNTTDLESAISNEFGTHGPTRSLAKLLDSNQTIPESERYTSNDARNQIHDTLFSNNPESGKASISTLVKDYLNPLSSNPNSLANQQAVEAIKQSLTPTYSLYAFNNHILDPGVAMLFNSQTSPFYGKQPKGTFKESTDISV